MEMRNAKMKSLEELIAAMDGHMLEPFNKKGKDKDPVEMSVDIEAAPEAEEEHGAEPEPEVPGEQDDLRKLIDMYKKQQDEEDSMKVSSPIPMG